ncbi:MAG: YARHG domain-containing protein [Bacteroidota bacterium]
MKNITWFMVLLLTLSCGTDIKDRDASVNVEAGTDTLSSEKASVNSADSSVHHHFIDKSKSDPEYHNLLGYWVGYFEKADDDYEKDVYVDEGFYWNRANKINISIDQVVDSQVIGHSVVAGNDRPFKGSIRPLGEDTYEVKVKEPGDDRYDGEFIFTVSAADSGQLKGRWTAYQDLDIKHRAYTLEKRDFRYDPKVMLERNQSYVDWGRSVAEKEVYKIDDNEFEEWVTERFASATQLIYKLNASEELLREFDVENLKRGDLIIIRNTIYARHGYSFKNRPLRVFFDAQSWYIPVHADIRADFTEIEKQNIQLLLKYEKNAAEYYDYFGRG